MSDPGAVQRAAALADAGSAAAAMQVLSPYLASEPDDPYALCVGAQSLLKLDDSARALELARRAASLNPGDDWAIRLQALACRGLDRFAEAQQLARGSVLVNPANWQTHYLVALADLWAGAVTDQSMAAIVRARELAPDEADTHRLLGSIALELGQPRVAARSLEHALRLDPEDAVARHELARAQLKQFRVGSALRGFLAVGQLDPSITQTRVNLHGLVIRAVVVLHYTMLLTLFTSAYLPIPTAVGVFAVSVGLGWWAWRRGGRPLFRFFGTLWHRDRFLVVWAGLLLAAAVLVVVRPLLTVGGSSDADLGILTLGRLLILAGAVLSWFRRGRIKRDR